MIASLNQSVLVVHTNGECPEQHLSWPGEAGHGGLRRDAVLPRWIPRSGGTHLRKAKKPVEYGQLQFGQDGRRILFPRKRVVHVRPNQDRATGTTINHVSPAIVVLFCTGGTLSRTTPFPIPPAPPPDRHYSPKPRQERVNTITPAVTKGKQTPIVSGRH